ncbi:hypothetical protein [Pectobacterium aquaticum]|uniref:hypothetical protein n=1 Tax=Pectobacterium aquaticum TaxID=2204145 RepID=UPI000E254450|nr:hypothetical protein [Pectobacterium aquaticum]UEM40633.1 hypothetical protein DMB82_0006530 [Pectobacterium aquaticum]
MTTSKRYEPVKKITVDEKGKTLRVSFEIFDHDAGHFLIGEDLEGFIEAKSRANALEHEHLESVKLKSTPKRRKS